MAARNEKYIFTLVIDAGHGGHDSGAVGAYSKEKNINLKVALAFGKIVESNCSDVKVIYTRKTDVFIPLQERANIANNAKADLFISIHTNALPNGKIAYGSETYSLGMARADENLAVAKRENAVITLESDYKQTYNGFDPNKAESYVIFEIMQNSYMRQSVDLASCIQKEYTLVGRQNKGVHQAGFLVLRNTSMPSVLTELGFITTPVEEEYLNSSRGIEELSRSIYNGFLTYLRKHDNNISIPLNIQYAETQSKIVEKQQQTNKQTDVAVVPVKTVRTKDITPSSSQTKKKDEEVPSQKEGEKTNKKGNNTERTNAVSQKSSTVKKETQTTKSTTNTQKKKQETNKKIQQKKSTKNNIVYRIQVGAGKVLISPTDPQFKGLKIERVKEGSFYKYFYGTYTTYVSAQKALRTVKTKMPNSYIVAYVNGKSVSVKEAREKESNNK